MNWSNVSVVVSGSAVRAGAAQGLLKISSSFRFRPDPEQLAKGTVLGQLLLPRGGRDNG